MSIEYEDIAGWRLERKPVYTGTWAGKPAANTIPLYSRVRITDYGVGGFSDWYTNGTRYVRGPLVIYSNGLINVSSTSATETPLLEVPIKAGSLGPNGRAELRFFENHANAANNRQMRLRIGAGAWSTSHAEMWTHNVSTTTQGGVSGVGFQNQNSVSGQMATAVPFGFGSGATTGTSNTGAVNTDADFNLFFSVLCVGGVDSFTLKSALLVIYPG